MWEDPDDVGNLEHLRSDNSSLPVKEFCPTLERMQPSHSPSDNSLSHLSEITLNHLSKQYPSHLRQ